MQKKKPLLHHPSEHKPPGGGGAGTCKLQLKYKVKQSKNGRFPSNYKLAQSILKRKFPSIHKPFWI